MKTKVCTKCGKDQPTENFYKANKKKAGFKSACKSCTAEYQVRWRRANKDRLAEYNAQYWQANKDRLAEQKAKWRLANKDRLAEYSAKYRRDNKDKIAQYRRANRDRITEYGVQYYQANKDRMLDYQVEHRRANKERVAKSVDRYHKMRYRTDPVFNLNIRVRTLVRRMLKGGAEGSTRHLPYTSQQLYDHLLSTLPEGYTEEDILDGQKLHIDHIRPISSFNLTGEVDDEFRKCWALSNLRLLPAAENRKKGASTDHLQLEPELEGARK